MMSAHLGSANVPSTHIAQALASDDALTNQAQQSTAVFTNHR
jgi:hypothetical protein